MNCGVIAPGNHWILDSLRGAPPPGEAMGAAAPEDFVGICKKHRNDGKGDWELGGLTKALSRGKETISFY